ncbi:MAG: LysM peptidoglycan-binding domain-containing protein [Clostridia bacterium]|nr:LysM peptidoglycan-binding domain-containing protein [Clostridia bacterium]
MDKKWEKKPDRTDRAAKDPAPLPPKEEKKISRVVCGEPVYTEVSEEFTLPEYEPEIRRILRVSARVLPSGRYIGAGKAEFAGTVLYSLLYQGEEGKTADLPLSSEYHITAPLADAEKDLRVFAETEAENTVCRPTGPRKVSFRTRLKSRIEQWDEETFPSVESASGSPEMLSVPAVSCRLTRTTTGEFEIAGEVGLGGALPLGCDGTLAVLSAVPGAGSVSVKGELWARITAEREGRLVSLTKRFPFEETADLPGVNPSSSCRASARCWSCRVDGEEGAESAYLTAVCEVEVECAENVVSPVVTDAYLVGAPSEAASVKRTFAPCLFCRSFHVSVSGKKAPEEGLSPEYAVFTGGEVSLSAPEVRAAEMLFSGTAVVSAACPSPGGEGAPASAVRIDLPFKASAPLTAGASFAGGPLSGVWKAQLTGVTLRPDGENLSVEAEVEISARVTEERTVTAVSSLSSAAVPPEETRPAAITVYYPQDGDTLWSVAKRFSVPLAALTALNGLDAAASERAAIPESLDGGASLDVARPSPRL